MAGERIAGRYRLIEPLGRGAMSSVWLAEDDELGRRVAVKTLAPSADRERFEREARAAASLSHPNICALYDYGEDDGKPFMVLEHLPNGSLEERLATGGPLADGETVRIATEVAAGLAHAHARGVVHRDLKPANVLFDAEGRAKIADFGIARLGGSGTLTEAGTVLGTASYISPEQASGRPASPASDVYSFGVILFRMLTGALPFVSSDAMELVRRHRDDPPPSVTGKRADAPPPLARLVTAALAKDPARRPVDGSALFARLRAGGEDATAAAAAAAAARLDAAPDTGATQVIGARPRGGPRRRRVRLLPFAAGALLLLGVAAALAFVGRGAGDAPRSDLVRTRARLPGLSLPSVPGAATVGSTSAHAATLETTSSTAAAAPTTTPPALPPATTRPRPASPTTTSAPATAVLPPTTTAAPATALPPPAPTTTEAATTTGAAAPTTTPLPPTTTTVATIP